MRRSKDVMAQEEREQRQREREESLRAVRDLLSLAAMLRRRTAQGLAGTPLTPDEWLVLEALAAEDGRTQGELAFGLLRDRGAVTRLVDSLVRQRLVKRREQEGDARVKQAFLTDKGRDVLERVRQKANESLGGLISPERAELVAEMLDTVRHIAEDGDWDGRPVRRRGADADSLED
jgi:DNA-binding MarR family transcriptional regulator